MDVQDGLLPPPHTHTRTHPHQFLYHPNYQAYYQAFVGFETLWASALTIHDSWAYSQTSLIRASLIRMPHNPNTLPGNLFYQFLFTMIQ